jgi:hypothetical protein
MTDEFATQMNNPCIDYDFDARKRRRNGKPLDIAISKENLLLMKSVLDKHHVTFWLLWGTLLGAVREKNFIEYDTDTDLGCFIVDKEKLIAAIPDLANAGLILIRRKYPDDLFTFMRNDEYIDIGLFHKGRDFFFRSFWEYQNNRIYGDHFKKFEKITFLGERFKIPYNSRRLFRKWYGKGWQKPQKDCPADAAPFSERLVQKLFRLKQFLSNVTRK